MTKESAPRRHLPTSPFKARPLREVEDFALGDRVSHDRYGLGTITAVELAGGAVLADFGTVETRVVSPYYGLHKL
ncbi:MULTISPECIES: hypothetical protein [Streptomyces]|uniref:ATP-binding protein n=1 Tax=Streptomyces solicathayae TaxID=3081768 RepID=A0ABZ0LMV8_9ACTN|nr:hypothetical protein [Streptomyces sp. HUAS YS2]WOX20630.1 hypothetical protein R2D22_04160 [Streptomyces sp. HUAS YS2]